LALRLLEKRGHHVAVVGTGRAALDALDRERFDAVLIDVQMPEMDGFEATAAIRDREKATGARLPVIAMTAHAMKGDREHCLEAGMDGYVSKPLRPEDLFAALEGSVPEGAGEPAAEPAAAVFDRAAALRRVGGDAGLLKELAGVCVEESPGLMGQIRAAIAERDGPRLRLAAHALKGSIGIFSAAAAHEAAWRMELVGRDENWADADAAWAALVEAIGHLLPALGGVTADQ
jgi:CheY-like chemotaxis protein